MEKIKLLLQGKKTYILAIVGVSAVWIDHFFGLGLSDSCKDVIDGACAVTTAEAFKATWGILLALAVKAGISR